MLKVPAGERDACSTDKNGTGYFVGIINRNTQYLVSTTEGIVTCATIRRIPDAEAYDKACMQEIRVKYLEYMRGGARTKPLSVRFAAHQHKLRAARAEIAGNIFH